MSENPSVHRTAAEGFSSGAETYVRGRPDYPPQALDWLRDTLGIGAGKRVVDLGAGTGKFTKVLLTTGAHVTAIDPVMPMLDRLRRDVPGARAFGTTRSRARVSQNYFVDSHFSIPVSIPGSCTSCV